MCEVVATKNEFIRHGGFSPQQWVLGKAPRGVGQILDEQELGDLGVLESQVDGATQFGRRSEMRFAARKAFSCTRTAAADLAPLYSGRQHPSTQVIKLEISSCTDSIAKQERTRLGLQQPESSDSRTKQFG